MIDSISSYLYAQSLNTETTNTNKVQAVNSEDTTSFAKELTASISNMSAMQELSNTLSGSVLGSLVSSTSDLQSLSEDLLNTGSGRKVIEQLAKGHLDSIVLTDNSKDSNESSIASKLTDYTEAVEETSSLESIVTQLSNLVGTVTEDEK